jgi:hypothetical protein
MYVYPCKYIFVYVSIFNPSSGYGYISWPNTDKSHEKSEEYTSYHENKKCTTAKFEKYVPDIGKMDENPYPASKSDIPVICTDILVKPSSVVKIDIPTAINININLILVQLIISTITSIDKIQSLSSSKDRTSDHRKYSNNEYPDIVINDDIEEIQDDKELKISNLSIMRIRNDTGLVLSYWHEGDLYPDSNLYPGSDSAIQVCEIFWLYIVGLFCYICIFNYLHVESLTYAFGWSAFLCRIRFCDTFVVNCFK